MSWTSRILIGVGLALLVPSGVWLLGAMAGVLPTDALALGAGSGLRTIAGLAVLGCLLAAAGFFKHEQERDHD